MRVNEHKVRDRAYQLWEREGRPEGAAHSHWKQATEELEAEAEGAGGHDEASGGVESSVAPPMPKGKAR